MTRRELMERRRRHQKIMRLRRIVKTAIYAFLVLCAFLLVWFVFRPLFTKGHAKKETAEETAPVVYETNEDGNTARKKVVSLTAGGDEGWNIDQTGWWYKLPDNTQYADGWQTIDGQKYYFGADGYLTVGWQTIDGEDHFFDPTAAVNGISNVKSYTVERYY